MPDPSFLRSFRRPLLAQTQNPKTPKPQNPFKVVLELKNADTKSSDKD